MGLFDKIKKLNIFSGFFSVDEDFFEELEENLILSDMGMDTTLEAVETLRERVKANKIKEAEEVKACLREILVEMLDVGSTALDLTDKPAVILMIGVNGVGKTTTIGKLAHLLKNQGNRVLLAARRIPSAPPPPISWPSGPTGRRWTSSAMRRGPTPPPWCSTP